MWVQEHALSTGKVDRALGKLQLLCLRKKQKIKKTSQGCSNTFGQYIICNAGQQTCTCNGAQEGCNSKNIPLEWI